MGMIDNLKAEASEKLQNIKENFSGNNDDHGTGGEGARNDTRNESTPTETSTITPDQEGRGGTTASPVFSDQETEASPLTERTTTTSADNPSWDTASTVGGSSFGDDSTLDEDRFATEGGHTLFEGDDEGEILYDAFDQSETGGSDNRFAETDSTLGSDENTTLDTEGSTLTGAGTTVGTDSPLSGSGAPLTSETEFSDTRTDDEDGDDGLDIHRTVI